MMTPNPMLAWLTLMDKLKKSQAGQFAQGAGPMLLPSADQIRGIPEGLSYTARHPVDALKLLGGGMQDASQDQFEKMFMAPSLSEKVGYGMAGTIPMLGPAAAMAGEEIGAGNTARGMGMAIALLAPSLYHGAIKPVMADVNLLRRAANIDAIRRANKVGFNLSADQAAGGRSALANMTEPAATSGREGSLSQLYGNAPVGAQSFIDSPLYPEGTLGNVRPELKATPSVNYDPLKELPSRRDALKVGAAAGAGAMLAPKLMEAVAKAPEASLPPRGLAAPSALGREGFYREMKGRVTDFDTGGWDDGQYGPKVLSPGSEVPVQPRDLNPEVLVDKGDRTFFVRAQDNEGGKWGYGKGVFKVNREENLRKAFKDMITQVRSDAPDGVGDNFQTVISEITPEAAMRLNTIEKPKVPLFTYGNKMGTGEHDHLFKLVDDSGNARAVGAIPPTAKDPNRMNSRDFARFERETMQRLSDRYGDHYEMYGKKGLKLTDTDWDIVPIEKDEFNNIGDFNDTHGQAGLLSNEVGRRPNTVGISPRYTKRVSIRLLKDTMAKQIAENKRAAGKGIPPLLAKPAVLQDNPALTRFDFLRGVKKNDAIGPATAIPLLGKSPTIITPKLPKGIDIVDSPPQMLFRGTPGERPWVSKVPKATYFTHDPSYAQEYGHTYALDAPRMPQTALLDMGKDATYDLFKKITGKNLDVEGGVDELMPYLNDLGLDAAHIPWLEALDDQYPRFSGPETILFHGKHGPTVTNPANYQPVLPPIDHRMVPAYRTRPTPEQIQALVEALRVRLGKP